MFPTYQQNFETVAKDVADFGQANLDAAMASTSVLTRGIDGYNKACFAYARTAYERGMAALQAMAQVKTPDEAMALQSDYARTLVDETVAQGKKLSDLCISVANDAAAPLQARVEAAMADLNAALPKAA